jgi:hypothetical protein
MPHVLRVTAFELRNPISLRILTKAPHGALHAGTLARARDDGQALRATGPGSFVHAVLLDARLRSLQRRLTSTCGFAVYVSDGRICVVGPWAHGLREAGKCRIHGPGSSTTASQVPW